MSSQPALPLTYYQCTFVALWMSAVLTQNALLAQEFVPTQPLTQEVVESNELLQTPQGTAAPQDKSQARRPRAQSPNLSPSRIQPNFPIELILPPPSDAAQEKVDRFVEAQIDPEIPLPLVLGRPKILRLADTPTRIYIPDDEIIRTEVIDQQTGRELAVTGVRPGTTTLMLWFNDEDAPSGQRSSAI